MNALQWSLIGAYLALMVVLVIFRHHPWVKKSWKWIVILAPIVFSVGFILVAPKKPQPAIPVPEPPKPAPVPVPITNVVTPTSGIVIPVPEKIITVGLDYQLSTHFTYGMMTKTEHRDLLDQNRDEGKQYLTVLANLCRTVLEPVWVLMGPITISSCFRCPTLNAAIGGAKNSQHQVGEAADTEYAGINLHEAFNKIAFSGISYSQIIIEFDQWVHVGLTDQTLYPGKIGQKLIASRQNSKTVYTEVTKPL